jgi:glycosyltransferase involved in cell wall biosynthesis
MHRDNLDFLKAMFINVALEDYHILVINQTTENKQLKSDFKKIRVINTQESGLSKSRNLALKEAQKKILLIADDDVVYLKDFGSKIITSFNTHLNADFISFKTVVDDNGTPFRTYVDNTRPLKKKELGRILSVEMCFKKSSTKKTKFNEWFGLGAKFPNMSNHFFLKDLWEQNLKFYEDPTPIVLHEPISSSDEISTDRILYTRGAVFYKKYGSFAYLHLAKYGFFMLRKNYVSISELPKKLWKMQEGIRDYKQLLKQGLDRR